MSLRIIMLPAAKITALPAPELFLKAKLRAVRFSKKREATGNEAVLGGSRPVSSDTQAISGVVVEVGELKKDSSFQGNNLASNNYASNILAGGDAVAGINTDFGTTRGSVVQQINKAEYNYALGNDLVVSGVYRLIWKPHQF
eukprot:EC096132.1.p2 GENE.EC096132.1~~EC096132.1.p2  ORF type:complete len:142 (+),score=7.31 EC096132.1:155-580(+)